MKKIHYSLMFLLFFLSVLVAGCRTQQPLEAKKKELTETNIEQMMSLDQQRKMLFEQLSNAISVEVSRKLENLTIDYEKTTYTPPDESGVQHKQSVETAVLKRTAEESLTDTTQSSVLERSATVTDSNAYQNTNNQESHSGMTEAEVKPKFNMLQSGLMWLGGLVGCWLLFKLIRKIR